MSQSCWGPVMVSNDGFSKKKCVILFQLQQSKVQQNWTYRGHQIMHVYYLLHSGALLDLIWRSVQQNGGISGEGQQKVDDFGGLWMIQHLLNLMSRSILFSPCQETGEETGMDKQKRKNNNMLTQPDCSDLSTSMRLWISQEAACQIITPNRWVFMFKKKDSAKKKKKTLATFVLNFSVALKFSDCYTPKLQLFYRTKSPSTLSEMWPVDKAKGLTFWSLRSGFVCSELKWPFMSAVGLSCSQNRLPLT